MDTTCVFCGDLLGHSESHKMTLRGIETIKTISALRSDGMCEKLANFSDVFFHEKCRKQYTRSRSAPSQPVDEFTADHVSNVTRSNVTLFKPKEECLFCGDDVTNKNKKLNRNVRVCATQEIKMQILNRAEERNDEWAQQVKLRVQGMVSDLVAGDGRYHTLCHTYFYDGRQLDGKKFRGRPANTDNAEALEKLSQFIVDSGECQFSLSELLERFEQFNGNLSQIHLKRELQRIYGSRIVFSEASGRRTIVSLKEKSNEMLYTEWKASKLCDERDMKSVIIDTAISILRQEISEVVHDNSYYEVGPHIINDSIGNLPPLLLKLVRGVVERKSNCSSNDKKCIFIVHALLSAARERSFTSTLLLGLGVYIHRLFGSRQAVDVLSALGCSASYHEVQRYEASAVMKTEEYIQYENDGFVQYVFDNADPNSATLDGSGSFHVLGGIECTTPASLVPKTTQIPRLVKLPTADILAAKNHVKLLRYRKTSQERSCVLKELSSLRIYDNFSEMLKLDYIWMFGYTIAVLPVSSWNGYMQVSMEGSNVDTYHPTHIRALPFINCSPSHPHTIYTALVEAERRTIAHGQKYCFFTGNLPTYAKARDIVSHMQEQQQLTNVIVRIGGFHLLMNFLGAIGYIMSGSGIEELMATIYARGSVDYMLNAKYYSRALRGHFLIHAALGKLIFTRLNLGDLSESEISALFTKFYSNKISATAAASDKTAIELVNLISHATSQISSYGPTAKLWIQYFELISLVKLFIRSERTGDWKLHLSCIAAMLPIFHAAGHLKYAKYAHIYLQDMLEIKSKMSEDEYLRFSRGGFTVRRNNWFWSGCWTDIIIEQELMRSIKSSGGLTRGRGITESTAAQFISSQSACLEIITSIEIFSGSRAVHSEQHKEIRDSRLSRDKKDVDILYDWLEMRNPFICSPNHLISLSTGTVADSSVNCHNAREIGESVILKYIGTEFSNLKFLRNDKVKNLTTASTSLKIRNEKVCVDPTLLFSRMLCLTPKQNDMKHYFRYELAPKAPALFDTENFMRKSCKSVLATEIKRNVSCTEIVVPETSYVIDGGFLLHSNVWQRISTYSDIINSYLRYIERQYPGQVYVIFDSYPDTPTTKDEEHRRRTTSGTSCYTEFELSMQANVEQERFLKNSWNKTRLIGFLTAALQTAGHRVIKPRMMQIY